MSQSTARVCASNTRHTVKREAIGRWILAGVCYGDTACVGVTFDTRALRTTVLGSRNLAHQPCAALTSYRGTMASFSDERSAYCDSFWKKRCHCRLWLLPQLHVSITPTFCSTPLPAYTDHLHDLVKKNLPMILLDRDSKLFVRLISYQGLLVKEGGMKLL